MVVLLASFLRSFAGFGFALVCTPLLSLRLPLTFALPMIIVFDLIIGGVLTADKWHRFRDPILYVILVGTVVGVYIGTQLLISLPEATLKPLLGLGIIAYAVRLVTHKRQRHRQRWARGMAVVAGLASGILGGMFGTSGPPLVMYLHAYTPGDKSDFRARMLVLLLLENLWRGVLYAREGLFTGSVLTGAVVLVPILGLGMWAGSRVHHRVSDTVFQRAIAALLILSGTALILR